MTRDDTSNVPLNSRPLIAKKADADLFVSIHNNALPDGVNPREHNGVATFFYQPHSMNLARAIQSELLSATESRDYGLYNGNFAVVRPTSYPAVLVECAFMILPEDEAKLKTPEFRVTVSKAITNGIRRFLKDAAKRFSSDSE
jgi:N-acetylmuramoyl-L-alanine amidase